MSAAVLREAATELRAQWGDDDGPRPMGTAWHPERDFHLAVADWLDGLVDAMTNPDAPNSGVSTDREEAAALTVARAYLGGDR